MKTILVVDDEERIRRVFWEVLRRRGFHVIKVKDAMEAHQILNEGQKVDLILLDINMPEVPGDTLNEVLQTFFAKTKVIVCSVLPVEEQSKRIPNADDYHDKSESFNILLQKINRVFEDESPQNHKKILIIDDNPKIRLMYRRLLMAAGYYPIDTGDHPDSFRFLKSQVKNIDLFLLDIAMPRISGLEYFKMIREKYPEAKVIITSVFSEDQQKYLIFKADDYFDKSEDHKVLLGKVKNLIGCNLN